MNTNSFAMYGGGCFWCTEAVFGMLRGIVRAEPGYAGGTVANPTYEQVSSGTTGHVEVVRIEFDVQQISFEDLLTVFFATHDPTTLNRQGNDVGTQYRSVVFAYDESQHMAADTFISKLMDEKRGAPVVTTVEPAPEFYPAEEYHKNYYEQHKDQPYCELVINPKLEKVQHQFAVLLKEKTT